MTDVIHHPLYINGRPICSLDSKRLERKDRDTYTCPLCNREYNVPGEVLMRESGAARLL